MKRPGEPERGVERRRRPGRRRAARRAQVEQVQQEPDVGQRPQQVASRPARPRAAPPARRRCRARARPGRPWPRSRRCRGISFIATNAPRNGMNIGADASIPSRRSWITCPSSCTSRSSDEPDARTASPRPARRRRPRSAKLNRNLNLKRNARFPMSLSASTPPRGDAAAERGGEARGAPAPGSGTAAPRAGGGGSVPVGRLARLPGVVRHGLRVALPRACPCADMSRALAPDPLLAALEDLLLPDRHGLLEGVDRLAAGVHRRRRGGPPRRR